MNKFKNYTKSQLELFIDYCGNGQFKRISRTHYKYSRTSWDNVWTTIVKYENPCEWACVNELKALNKLCKDNHITLSKFFYQKSFDAECTIMKNENTTLKDLKNFLEEYYYECIEEGILDGRIAKALIKDSIESWRQYRKHNKNKVYEAK